MPRNLLLCLVLEIVRSLSEKPALQVEFLDYWLSNSKEAAIGEELKLLYIDLLCRQFPKKVVIISWAIL